MPTTHTLHVQQRWFDLICTGAKRHEGRLNDSDVNTICAGDAIVFETDGEQTCKVKVAHVRRFTGFDEMFQVVGLPALLPGVETMEEGLEIYRSFPGYREGEQSFGVVVFEIVVGS